MTQIIDVKHFTEEDLSSVTTDVRRSEWADNGYTFGHHSQVNEISLDDSINSRKGRERNGTHVGHDVIGWIERRK